ncbi:MAG: hypothetical protein WBK28_01060 [Minisyncoccia bacterium]
MSAYRKTDALAGFAQHLTSMGYHVLASSGTKSFLDTRGIISHDVTSAVGAPILGHRVVTLSREIFASILARRGSEEDSMELKRLGLAPIELVYVDFYPLLDAILDPSTTEEEIIEKIDIGGPTLLRAAAKAERIAVPSEEWFPLAQQAAAVPIAMANTIAIGTIRKLAYESEQAVARYSALTATFYEKVFYGTLEEWRTEQRAARERQ